MPEGSSHSLAKVMVAVLVIVCAGGWMFHRARGLRPGAMANNGVSDDIPMPTSQEIRKAAKGAAAYADLSTTQAQRVEEIAGGFSTAIQDMMQQGDRGSSFSFVAIMPQVLRMQEMAKELTPDQRERVRAYMQTAMGKRRAKIQAALSEQEYKRFQEKMRERFPQGFGGMGRLGGGRGGPFGFGGPGAPSSQSPQATPVR
jgi:hypothetical protein